MVDVVYEVIWKNTVELGRPRLTVWRMRIACCVPKATNTHSEYVILIAFPLQQWLHERASVLLYASIACLVFSNFEECFDTVIKALRHINTRRLWLHPVLGSATDIQSDFSVAEVCLKSKSEKGIFAPSSKSAL